VPLVILDAQLLAAFPGRAVGPEVFLAGRRPGPP